MSGSGVLDVGDELGLEGGKGEDRLCEEEMCELSSGGPAEAILTFFDVGRSQRLLVENLEVQRSTIPNLVIHIIQASTRCMSILTHPKIPRTTITYLRRSTLTLRFKLGSLEFTPNLAKLVTAAALTVAFSNTTRL